MTGRGVTVVVVDDGVEHTIKDIQPNYVSACSGTGACESSVQPAPSPGAQPGRKVPAANLAWEILHLGFRVTSLCAGCGRQLASL